MPQQPRYPGHRVGHQLHTHLSALRGDTLNAPLLGMTKVVSEDSVRRNLGRMDEADGVKWLQDHLDEGVAPLLSIPWILDSDVTVKPLYGHQEWGGEGLQPPQTWAAIPYVSYLFHANLRLILDLEVQAGNQTASKYNAPALWELLKRLPRPHWPVFIRGDRDWGTEANRQRAEQEGLPYRFKVSHDGEGGKKVSSE